ncbi:MAG: EAL domain-containing protein [Pseudomonadota bacterium]|nr:EAL domain-containing protein [Pseudomonadota bacterium]
MIPLPARLQRSMSARLVALFLGLLLAMQVASFTALRASLSDHAHNALPDRLEVGDRVLQSLLDQRAQKLIEGARLLAADYGFREALGSNDAETIVSALDNHGSRIGASESALLSTDFKVRSSTTHRRGDLELLVARLSVEAARSGQASTVALLAGTPHQAVLVPVKAPVTVGWIMMAFPLDKKLVKDLTSLSTLDVSLLTRATAAAPWNVALTSLEPELAASLAAGGWSAGAAPLTAAARAPTAARMASLDFHGEEFGVRPKWLSRSEAGASGAAVVALVSLSVDDAVRLPADLQLALLGITLLATIAFALGSVFAARGVTLPIQSLAGAAERLGAGDFVTPIGGTERTDEIGNLAKSFERMRIDVAQKQHQVQQLAYWDSLTGLPNRVQFRQAVQDAIEAAAPGSSVSVVMLDLDRFRHVNDALGYHFGDILLAKVGERLNQQAVRGGDMVARLGGDEFAVLLRGGDASLGLAVAQRIERSFTAPLELEEHTVDMGASIGIASWPLHAADANVLVNHAELAMYSAKRRSVGVLLYEASMDVASGQTLTLLTELRQAVDRNELRLYLQPQLALDSGKLVGAEALVRWQHPERGLVPPFKFIPFAEQTGFIRVLTIWVFGEAARQSRELHDLGLDLVISVNLSTRDLIDADLPQKFALLLAEHGVAASAFCLEITESAIMEEPQRALATLERLSAAGFRLSIDDFGTGHSSLAYLKRLPVHELKIDQSFVLNMKTDTRDAAIVRSTIDLAHNLGLSVVAEGVETAEVWDLLRDLHCDLAQGYHMGRPMPADELPGWSERWNGRQQELPSEAAMRLH